MEASAIWYKTPSIVSELVLHYVRLASWHELNFQNRGAKGSVDVKAHNRREVSVKKRKSREQDYLGNNLGESDANAFEWKFSKQKKSKAIQTEEKKSSRSKGEGKSTRRDTGIKDSAPIEREHQTNKYRVKHQNLT
ncbi:hypothetical protein KY289_033481 [Solanum tuberosum]|nr:hypothetical protein KY289_033481 [Solanum tuberosum]